MATKDELETEKLLLEITELRRPWYKKPAYVLPTIVVLGTLATGFITQFFQAEFTKFENQKHDLQHDNDALVRERNDLNDKIATLQREKQSLTSQSLELSDRTKDVAHQLRQVNDQRKQLVAERVRLNAEQSGLEADYAHKRLELEGSLSTKTAEYEKKRAELDRQFETQKKELDAKIADIQQRLLVAPVLDLIAEIQRDDVLSLGFKPDELLKLLLQNEEDRPARLELVKQSLAGADDPLFKSKLLYVMFGATRDEKWKKQFVDLVRSDPARMPLGISTVLAAGAWHQTGLAKPSITFGWNTEPEMCELGITVLTAHPAPKAEQKKRGTGNKLDQKIAEQTEQIDAYERTSLFNPCERLEKPLDRIDEFHDPQLLLTGVRIARDQALKERNIYSASALDALYKLSRPAAFCTSMRLLNELPRPRPVELPVNPQIMLRERLIAFAIEAEEATSGHKPNERSIRPFTWLRENRELVKVWMEDDLQTLRSKPSDVRLTLTPSSK